VLLGLVLSAPAIGLSHLFGLPGGIVGLLISFGAINAFNKKGE